MRWFIICTLIVLLLAACGPEAPITPATPATTPTGQSIAPTGQAIAPTSGAYPNPAAYPQPQQTGNYPAPDQPQGPAFSLNLPVKTSDALVTGSGPAGVPIRLISMNIGGETIAQTTIDAGGKFSFNVGGQLTPGDRIGVMLGELAGTGFNSNDFLHGPGYEDIPFIGILLTSTVVE